MIKDHRPLWLKRLHQNYEVWYTDHFLSPQFESLGAGHFVMKPWNLRVYGKKISAGKNLHVIADPSRKVSLSTWGYKEKQGQIEIGDNVLICPGTRIDSASGVRIKSNCMLAAGTYLTDADWHDVYDRTRPIGTTKPITLEENVWIGDSTIVCKGVTIGKNSIIGAGSVVASDIPSGVIAAGNPATPIKKLSDEKSLVTRDSIFADLDLLDRNNRAIDEIALADNTLFGWVRNKFFPRSGD